MYNFRIKVRMCKQYLHDGVWNEAFQKDKYSQNIKKTNLYIKRYDNTNSNKKPRAMFLLTNFWCTGITLVLDSFMTARPGISKDSYTFLCPLHTLKTVYSKTTITLLWRRIALLLISKSFAPQCISLFQLFRNAMTD